MTINQAAIIQAIYDTIFAAYTQPPISGLPAPNTAQDVFLNLEWPGQQIDVAQFQNPWSPQNLSGSPLATEMFSNLVNVVPAIASTYRDTGVTVEEMYSILLSGVPDSLEGTSNPVTTAFYNAKKVFDLSRIGSALVPQLLYHPCYASPGNWYEEAASQTWAKVTIRSTQLQKNRDSVFEKTGGVEKANSGVWKIPSKVSSNIDPIHFDRFKKMTPADPILRSRILKEAKVPASDIVKQLPTYSADQTTLQSAQDLYDNAVANLNANRFQYDLSDPNQQAQWTAIAPKLEADVQAAWTQLQQVPQVDLESIPSKSVVNDPPIVLRPPLDRLKDVSKLPNIDLHSKIGKAEIPSGTIALDSNVLKSVPIGAVVLPRDRVELKYDVLKRYLKIQDDSLGDTSDLEISFRFCRVAIQRPWIRMSLMKLAGWHLTGQAAGSLSTGQIQNNSGSFPLIPTAFIAVRDLQIRGTWSQKDRTIAEMATAGSGGNVAFGPFSLSGRYGSDQAGSVYQSKFDGATLFAPGLQVLGWINQPVPLTPPSAG